jgi:hypothetical protein
VRRALALAVALLAFAPAAHAADVARAPLGWTFGELVAGTDGGAWVSMSRGESSVVGHTDAGGVFRTVKVDGPLLGGTLGPDGQAWFHAGLDRIVRVDSAARVTTLGPFEADDSPGFSFVTGPDGAVWAPTIISFKLARVTPAGEATFTPLKALDCGNPFSLLSDVARASDGAVWIAEFLCQRLIRVAPDGTAKTVAEDFTGQSLVGDLAGGMFFGGDSPRYAGHIDANGKKTYPGREGESARDVALAPDGAAWFALGRCALARVTLTGAEIRPAPVPTSGLAFDPAGGLWLSSRRHLVHTTLDALNADGCDETPARLTAVTPRTISLAGLRRDGLRLRVSEPAEVQLDAIYDLGGSHQFFAAGKRIVERAGATIVYRPTERRLRRIARELDDGERVRVSLGIVSSDAEGNHGADLLPWRITR